MAGLCAPLSTLRRCPRGHLRMTRGRCGSLLLHRDGLAPSTPCRSPGALRSTPTGGQFLAGRYVSNLPQAESSVAASPLCLILAEQTAGEKYMNYLQELVRTQQPAKIYLP